MLNIKNIEKCTNMDYISSTLKKLKDLLESELSSCLTSRQIEYLELYFRRRPKAHSVKDLPLVTRLLELLTEKNYTNDLMKEYFRNYLYLCGIPPLSFYDYKNKNNQQYLIEYFSVLGGLIFLLKEEDLVSVVLKCLICVLRKEIKWPPYFVSLNDINHAVSLSHLPKIVGKLLKISEDKLFKKSIELSILIAQISSDVCYEMIKEGAIDSILIRVESTWLKKYSDEFQHAEEENELYFYENFSTLIWLLLDSLATLDEEKIKIIPPISKCAFWNIRYGLKVFFSNSRHKINRNNFLLILFKIVQYFPNSEFVRSGLAQDIVDLNLVVETNCAVSSYWPSLKLESCNEDFIFVKLLLMFIPFFAKPEYYGGMQILKRINFFGYKMKILTHSQMIPWHQVYVNKIICIFVAVFTEIAHATMELFLADKGIIKFSDLLTEENSYSDVKLAVLTSLIIVGKMDKLQSGIILNRMIDIKLDSHLISIGKSLISKSTLDIKYQLSIAYIFGILEQMYKRDIVLANNELMSLVLDLLKRISSNHTFILPQLPILIISCLCNILLCDQQNLKQFIVEEGIYMALDITETSVWPVKVVALGLLAEVSEEPISIPFLITWKGKRNQNILSLLLEIFRKENQMLGVKQTIEGLILDDEFPLMGKEQYQEISNLENKLEESPAISEIIGSCRPKIYAIMKMLSYKHEDEVQKSNEIYKTWNQELSLSDQMTKFVVENFFAIKIGEVWNELQLHFERSGIRPAAYDYEVLFIVLNRAKKWGNFLQNTQRDFSRLYMEKKKMDEELFYMQLRESRLAQTLAACTELEHIARCSKELFRIKAKRKLNIYLMEYQLKPIDTSIIYHTIFMYDIMVNPVFDQILQIANVSEDATKIQSMAEWVRKAYEKVNKPEDDELPSGINDELWESITQFECITK